MSDPIRVFIVDDHDDVRRALSARLSASPHVTLVGEAAEVEAALRQIQALRPDATLVESKRADGRGLEVVSAIARNSGGTRVVVLTSYLNEWEEWAIHRAGAASYLLKGIDTNQLIAQLRATVT
ncbi:MAG: response regulator [Anaerolineales bacterium]